MTGLLSQLQNATEGLESALIHKGWMLWDVSPGGTVFVNCIVVNNGQGFRIKAHESKAEAA